MITNIIYSKNRAMQLEALLRSINDNCNVFTYNAVIWKATDSNFKSSYEWLQDEFPDVIWVEETKKEVKDNSVILYCASMMTNVLIDDIYNEYASSITQIDCGSLFEPYLGLATRTYHKKLIQELKK